jgi:perosamine synthetase
MLTNVTCNSDDSLITVMALINENAMGVCFVVDNKLRLQGVLTDGDLRRAILSGISLQDPVKQIVVDGFVVGLEDDSAEQLIEKTSEKIRIIPIVDSGNKLIDYFSYNPTAHFPVAIPSLNGNELKYLTDAFLSTWISSQGDYLDWFEEKFAEYCDSQYGIAVSNGTVALHLALMALDIGEGDEVIVPDLTFAATINAVLHTNATPVIVDIEYDSWCISPVEIENAITPKTKAIIPVHLYGQPCDMGAIMEIAKRHNLKVIEDCAEAHGAKFDGKKVGCIGDIGCFSFYGNKVITTGEGGMCVTNTLDLKNKLTKIKNHGMSTEKSYWHDVIGYNYRLTNLQAAIGLAQLERIDEIHDGRMRCEKDYFNLLSKHGFTVQKTLKNRDKITWLVSALIPETINRDDFIAQIKSHGIDVRPFFCQLSSMPIYQKFSNRNNRVSREISSLGVSFPTYENYMSITKIINILNSIMNNRDI